METSLMENVEARTSLAGSNKMELLLFSLGTKEWFGLNVFKVREVGKTPHITRTPNMPSGVEGLVSLRGNVIPVLSLAHFFGLRVNENSHQQMMVAEYSKKTLGFLVHGVDRIVRVDWDKVHAPENLSASSNLITAVVETENGLISIVDVEQILTTAFGDTQILEVATVDNPHALVFFVDDSGIARKKISETLEKMGVKHKQATNGMEGWTRLQGMASHAQQAGKSLKDEIDVILVDAEMPEMDGYVLTKNIKADARFEGIPVVMHSSLSSDANRAMGRAVGVDAYVAKFDAEILSSTLRPYLS